MAAETEGIALLSAAYNDEEEEDDETHEEPDRYDSAGVSDSGGSQKPSESSLEKPSPLPHSRSPFLADLGEYHKTLRSPVAPTPPLSRSQHSSPFPLTPPSPPPPRSDSIAEALDPQRMRRALAIVDYAHDEAAMSPETEEGEILSGDRVVSGAEVQVIDGNLDERTPPGMVHILTPRTQIEPSQTSDVPEQVKSETIMAVDFTGTKPEVAQAEEAATVSVDMQKDDPLSCFLPPPVTTKCSEELQQKMNRFLAYKKSGKSFNADLRNRKDYRNPDFLQHAVRYQDIDQIGTCFSKDVFDPHGYDKSDYYDEIEADMKRELERKEQERKKSQKVDFVAGPTQPSMVAPILKTRAQIPVVGSSAVASSGLPPVPATVDAAMKDIRQSKKTKWDKIDDDVKSSTLSAGHDKLSTVGVHAALLTAANAGAGYTAFAQQKRREAEEKRTNERRFDKRS
ncbi:uncharacterized protein [Typha latifolia]|uniref:uncharacterized protein n=1 Tax=Typha latifolia TaxID=4733 RepID=UPI003C2E2584